MIDLIYRKLTMSDIPAFLQLRMIQLQEEGAEKTCDLTPHLVNYYTEHLADNSFLSWIALDGDKMIATSGLSFVSKPPWYRNPTGKIGLVSSMYTQKEYRRKGIAKKLLACVMDEAKNQGCGLVYITASDIGIPLYQDYGFKHNANFMEYGF